MYFLPRHFGRQRRWRSTQRQRAGDVGRLRLKLIQQPSSGREDPHRFYDAASFKDEAIIKLSKIDAIPRFPRASVARRIMTPIHTIVTV